MVQGEFLIRRPSHLNNPLTRPTAIQGMDKQITKGVLSQAILFTTKDQYTFAVIALIQMWNAFRARAKLPLASKA